MIENMPENGVQQLSDIIVEQRCEEDTPMLHLELEDSDDANIHEMSLSQNDEIEHDVEDMVNNMQLAWSFCHYCFLIFN